MLLDKNKPIYIVSPHEIKPQTFEKPSTKHFDLKYWIVMFSIALSLSTTIALAVVVISGHLTMADLPPAAQRNTIEYFDSQEYIDRKTWGGKPPSLPLKPLRHPIDLVIIAHTATRFCSTFEECSKVVVAAQNYHFKLKMSDISYNFLIGGDANVYVGRGWDAMNNQKDQSISVSFIGNFLTDYLTADMIDALQELLNEGVQLGKLTKDYRIVCHNQTVATLSPGDHVYTVLKTWSHFEPRKLF